MREAEASDPKLLAHYEGLVRKTSARYEGIVEGMDFEDICQVFRLKVWRALCAYDPAKCRTDRDRYVFMCVRNQGKDLAKRKRTGELYIEDLTETRAGSSEPDRFEGQYLEVREDEVFGEIEAECPLIPSTLTLNERRVLVCLYLDYSQPEAALRLGLTRKEVTTAIRGIRVKMGDWRPDEIPVEAPVAIAA